MPNFAESFIYLLLLLCILIVYYVTRLDATKKGRNKPPLAEASQTAPHRHSCRYCRQLCIAIPRDFSNQNGLLIRLSLTFLQVAEAEARACPLLERAHDASTAAVSERIRSHLQTFFDIFSASSNLHALTGCSTIAARAQYFVRGLSRQPFHLRLGHLSSESEGVLRARMLYTSWRLFEFSVSADEGDYECSNIVESD